MSGQPSGHCQVCGDGVTGYSVSWSEQSGALPAGTRLDLLGPMTAEPCGHVQPEPVDFPGVSPTFRRP